MRRKNHQVLVRLDDSEREYLNRLGKILSLNDQNAIRTTIKATLDEIERARQTA